MAELDYFLRERLLALARIRLKSHPVALAAFEKETAKPDGGAIGATVSLLDMPGFRLWAAMGDADKLNHKLLPVIDNWAAVHRAVEHLLPMQAEPPDPGPREATAAQYSNGTKRWTPESMRELAEYRQKHGTKKAASWAGVTESRVRALLPRGAPRAKGYGVFTHRSK